MSKKFAPFSNKGKPLVVQFIVKHEQNIDCGGGYVKIFDCKLDQKDMHGETPYEIMFGKILNINQSKISFVTLELLCGRTLLIYTRYNAPKQVYQMLLVKNLICNRINRFLYFSLLIKK